jgi:uncharacterized protein (TIGR01777 family)
MNPALADQRIVVTGSTGLVGTRLVAELARAGAQVVRAVRRPVSDPHGELFWDPAGGKIDGEQLAGADAVVHLAGENIAGGRWTPAFKQRIRDSRTKSTRLLSETIASLADKPRTFVCASAIGYYGDRGDEVLTEPSPPADDFLADVCREWEAACLPARDAGVRVANTRIGVVLSPQGGALKKMLTPFKLGAGGRLGSGRQYMSWVALDDVVEAIGFILATPTVYGPANLTAPNPVTNLDFTKTLGSVLSRPTIFPLPAFAARLIFGEAADALLLSSTRALPQTLEQAGYQFRYPELEPALRHLLQR